jgi:20S proteasome subunit beta 3
MDLIGSMTEPQDFMVGGTSGEQLMAMSETLWEPNMGPEQLFECISQSMMNAFDRDAISGWGAVVRVVEKDKVTTRTMKGLD